MASEGMHSPVEQFEIKRFIEFSAGGYDISFTNSSLFMLLAMIVGGTFLTVAMSKREMVPGRLQSAAEMMYEFVADMVGAMWAMTGAPISRSFSPCLCSYCSATCWASSPTPIPSLRRLS